MGINVTIFADNVIGNNVIVGAGAVVTTNVKDNLTVVGVTAQARL